MSEPFFDFIANNRQTISNSMYGFSDLEKRYHRNDYHKLPSPDPLEIGLKKALNQRRSVRSFSNTALSIKNLSTTLYHSLTRNEESWGLKKYPFPSGGGFYPIETYLTVYNVEGFDAGLYHYMASEHSITKLKDIEIPETVELNRIYGCLFENNPSLLIQMTMCKNRNIKKYGSLAYVLSLVEAGHRGQNLSLLASALDLGICSMGGGLYREINNFLEIDGSSEHYIYGLALGTPEQNSS